MTTIPSDNDQDRDDEWTKPAFLRRVRIRGYKSLAFCDVALEPLTVLVGRNASGKSNFVDALTFLRDLMEMRATEAVNERKGWRAIHCRNGSTPHIEMVIEATVDSFQSTWDANYNFSLEISKLNQIRIRHENLTLTEQKGNRQCGYRSAEGTLIWLGQEHFKSFSVQTKETEGHEKNSAKLEAPQLFGRRRYDRLLLSVIGTQPFLDLSERLRASNIYNFYPPVIRTHQPITASPILSRDGSNLARAIEGLREIEPETIERITDYLKAIVPGVQEFQTVEYGDFETVRFSLETAGGQPPLEFDASSMSDGTLRILASLIAAFQIVLPMGFPGFIGIEEPETALHPAAMRALVGALDEATSRTQVLLTTHSADLLDTSEVRPENVRVVEMIDGKTIITPVDEASREIVRRKLETLGELERQNRLELNPADLKRQQHLAEKGQEETA